MATKSLAHPAPPVPESEATGDLEHVETIAPRALKLSARLQRGITLAQERFDEIERIAPWTWSVPGCSGEGR